MAAQAATEGRFLGGRPPYGYRLADAGPHPNPGKAALEGALAPPKGDWLYFVAIDKKGHSAFSVSYADQQKNEAIARQTGFDRSTVRGVLQLIDDAAA